MVQVNCKIRNVILNKSEFPNARSLIFKKVCKNLKKPTELANSESLDATLTLISMPSGTS